MDDALIERLNCRKHGHRAGYLTNPDGPEAASRIADLEAKLATAVGALETVIELATAPVGEPSEFRELASDALASIQERT